MREIRRRRLLRGPTLHPLAASKAIAADGVIAAGHHLGGEEVFHDAIMLRAMFLHFAIQSEMQHATIIARARQRCSCEYLPRSGKQLQTGHGETSRDPVSFLKSAMREMGVECRCKRHQAWLNFRYPYS